MWSRPFRKATKGSAPTVEGVFLAEVDGQERLVVVQEVERHRTANPEEIIGAIRRNVSKQHELGLDAVLLVKAGSVPKTTSGKIQRHACRDGYLNGTLAAVARWELGQPLEVSDPGKNGSKSAAKPKRVAAVQPPQVAPPSRNGKKPAQPRPTKPASREGAGKTVEEIVLEEVRRVAQERADGMDIDTPITELGMDSLERTEIVAALEERFGGRFPEEILPENRHGAGRLSMQSDATLVGRCEKLQPVRRGYEAPVDAYRFEKFPEYVRLREGLDLLESTGLSPYFSVHESVTADTTVIDGRKLINFSSYKLSWNVRAIRSSSKLPNMRVNATGRAFRPVVWYPARKTCTAIWNTRHQSDGRSRRGNRLCGRSRNEREYDWAPVWGPVT